MKDDPRRRRRRRLQSSREKKSFFIEKEGERERQEEEKKGPKENEGSMCVLLLFLRVIPQLLDTRATLSRDEWEASFLLAASLYACHLGRRFLRFVYICVLSPGWRCVPKKKKKSFFRFSRVVGLYLASSVALPVLCLSVEFSFP